MITDIDDDVAAEIVLVVFSIGGVHSAMRLPRRRRGQRRSTSADVNIAAGQLVPLANYDLTAGRLNRNPLKTAQTRRRARRGGEERIAVRTAAGAERERMATCSVREGWGRRGNASRRSWRGIGNSVELVTGNRNDPEEVGRARRACSSVGP